MKNRMLFLSLLILPLTKAIFPQYITAIDNAANYEIWTGNSNGGFGFGAWDLWVEFSAGHFIGNATAQGFGDVNTESKAFGMWGNPSGTNVSHAQRLFTNWADGASFSVQIATAYRNGYKGIDLWAEGFDKIWTFNVGEDQYTAGGVNQSWSYSQTSVFTLTATQNGTNVDINLTRGSDIYSTTISNKTLFGFKFYIGSTNAGDNLNNLYFNNLKIEYSDPSKVPVGASVQISSNTTLSSGLNCTNLTITSGNSLNVNPLATLTVSGTLTNSGTLTLKSNASGTGSLITNGTVTGNIMVERYIPGNSEQWHLVSSPVAAQGISGSSNWTPTGSYLDGSGYDFYAWHESGKIWVNRKNTTATPQGDGPRFDDPEVNGSLNFVSAKGYLSAFQFTENPTKTFSGAPTSSNQTFTLSRTGSGLYVGLNLIGNPFTSTIAGNNNADGTNNFLAVNASKLHDTAVAYYVLNNGNYNAVNQSSAANYIAVGQGFFVVAKNHDESISFNTNLRKHGNSTFYKNSDNRNAFKIHLASVNSNSDATELFFRNDMTTALDPGYDAVKLLGFSGLNVYTRLVSGGNSKFDIQALPVPTENMIIPLGLFVTDAGYYHFTFEPTNQYLNSTSKTFLFDKVLNTQVQLDQVGSYGFSIETPGEINNRFELRFGVVGITEKPSKPALQAYVAAGQLHVLNLSGAAQLEIYDLSGRLLQRRSIVADGTHTQPMALPAGVYVVRATTPQSSKAVKVIVQ